MKKQAWWRQAACTAALILFAWSSLGAESDTAKRSGIVTTSDGVVVTVAGLSPFTIEYPLKSLKILDCQADGTVAKVSYEGGTQLKVAVKPDGAIDYFFTNFPESLKSVDLWMSLDRSFGDGGSYRLNDEELQPFPVTPPKIFFVQKHNARRWSLHDKEEHNLVFSLPGHTYLQMEDRRAEDPSRYRMIMAAPVLYGNPSVTVRVGDLPVSKPPADQSPISVGRMKQPILVDGTMEDWKGVPVQEIASSRVVDGKVPEGSSASFRVGWDDKNLYLLAEVKDATPLQNLNPFEKAWAGDAFELFIGGEPVSQMGDLLHADRQWVFGASVSGVVVKPGTKSIVVPCEGGWILEAAIPFASLGWTPEAGHKFRFDVGIDDSADGKNRLSQTMWNGTNRNALNRTDWGWAVLEK